jgi:hypothetical protein
MEMPEARFEDVFTIAGCYFARKGRKWIAHVRIDSFLTQLCAPSTFDVVSVCPDTLAMTAGRVQGKEVIIETSKRCNVVVRISGVRKDMMARWPRFTAAQATSNAEFWAQAHRA